MNKVPLQGFFENLFLFSIHGMGYGESELEENGEEDVLKNIRKNHNNRLVIFDVGANIGQYASACKRHVPSAEVYSFEPSKKTFEILKNKSKDLLVKAYNIGFGEKKGTKTLFSDQDSSGLASLYKRDLEYRKINFEKKETVKIETIDEFCEKNIIEKIDLLKIDVEGSELSVLNGAKKMLRNRKIKQIQFEFGGCNISSRVFFKDFWNLLNKDYSLYRIIPHGLVPVKNYTETMEIFTLINYLAILKNERKIE